MKTYIDEEVGRVFCFTLAEVKELLNRIAKGIKGNKREMRICLVEIAVQLVDYIKKAEE